MDRVFSGATAQLRLEKGKIMNKEHFAIEEAQSVIRSRVLEIRAIPDDKLTTELRAERDTLDKKYAEGEVKFRASIKSLRDAQEKGTTVDSAETELRALTTRSNLGGVLSAAMGGRPTEGAEAELQQHYGLAANQVPIEMLRVEERAAATVPASIGDATQAEVITPVFATGDGAFLGIERPTVAVGDAAYPVLSTVPSVKGPFTDSSDAAQTDAVFVANTLAPERLQASYSYRQSDASRFAGLDASLRVALNAGLQEKLDQQAINGGSGLLNGSNLSNNNVTAITSWVQYLDRLLYGRVDGRYARSPADVRILLGSAVFTHLSVLYKSSESDETGSERLAARSGGLIVSAHVPGISSKRQNTLMRLGSASGAAVQPIWNAVTILVDPFSKSVQGEVVVHASLMSNFAITQSGQWFKQQAQTTA